MNIYTGLPTAIGANVTGFLGRVFPIVAPEGYATPYCVYDELYSSHVKTLDGYEGEKEVDYQIDFFADTYAAAKIARETFVDYIKNYKGTLGTAKVQDVEIIYETESTTYVGAKIRYNATVDIKFVCVSL